MSLRPFAVCMREVADLLSPEQRLVKARIISGACAIERLARSLRWMIAMQKANTAATLSRFDTAVLKYAEDVLQCYGDPTDKLEFESGTIDTVPALERWCAPDFAKEIL